MRKKIIILLLLALCLSLCACGEVEEEVHDSVSIWYIKDAPLSQGLRELAEEYNAELEPGLLPVELRELPDEESLALAFSQLPPDLLLCSLGRAEELSRQQVLQDLPSAPGEPLPRYPEYMYSRFNRLGRSFFPIGSETELLYYKEGSLSEAELSSLPLLLGRAAEYGREQRLPFFAAERFSRIFYSALLSLGEEFHADRRFDLKNPDYKEVYNLIAETAFSSGLLLRGEKPADTVEAGHIPCAVLSSASLPGHSLQGFSLSPLPGMEEGGSLLAENYGLALTVRQGRSLKSLNAFLRWLFSEGRLTELSLKGGCIPSEIQEQAQGETPLEALLIDMQGEKELHIPDISSDFIRNEQEFELQFRAALEKLY